MDELDGSDTLVIYHGSCNDGHCAAWVARKVFPKAKFFPACHGTPPPDVRGKHVLMFDFVYKRAVMENLHDKAASLVAIDHHKTAADDLAGLPYCRFDMSKSGATLAWDYFRDLGRLTGERPWLVSYTEDRDLDRWALPYTREVNAALTTHPLDFGVWDSLEAIYPTPTSGGLINDGRTVLRCHERLIETVLKHSRRVRLDDYVVKAGNTPVLHGEVAARLAEDGPFGISWYEREDGRYIYSLRSREDGVDVSAVAAAHGGGGHEHSAGFSADDLILSNL